MAIWDGKIVATSTGGTFSALTPKLYRLDGGAWTTTPTFSKDVAPFIPVAPGAHTVTVMDANNCIAVANVTLIEPTAVSVLNVSTVDPTYNPWFYYNNRTRRLRHLYLHIKPRWRN